VRSARWRNYRRSPRKAHSSGALVIAAADLLALTVLPAPAAWGADIAVGTTQRFGVPLFYGGPHAGVHRRGTGDGAAACPDVSSGCPRTGNGTPALRLALQTREQHIRREKATSNICTAQVLLAVVAAAYAVYHGPAGLRGIAHDIARATRRLAAALVTAGYTLASDSFFDTVTVTAPDAADRLVRGRPGAWRPSASR
jgi:glycine dehydrogenase